MCSVGREEERMDAGDVHVRGVRGKLEEEPCSAALPNTMPAMQHPLLHRLRQGLPRRRIHGPQQVCVNGGGTHDLHTHAAASRRRRSTRGTCTWPRPMPTKERSNRPHGWMWSVTPHPQPRPASDPPLLRSTLITSCHT